MLSTENPTPSARTPWRRLVTRIVSGFAFAATLGCLAIYSAERASLKSWARKTERFVPKTPMRYQFFGLGLDTPGTLPAEAADLGGDEPVVGIEAGGKARAYHLRSMAVKSRHIVNDVVGGAAVTVTYCDLSDCVRAFGGAESKQPLAIALAGLLDGQMLIKVGDVTYAQETGAVIETDPGKREVPLPYPSVPTTRTTWREWKARHPDTDVYLNPSTVHPK